ncbi:MAG: DinB family protein [Candidatus Krumholzibacteriia bacterium]
MIERPARNEYDAYYHRYVDQVPDGDVLETMAINVKRTLALLEVVGEEGAGYRYAPDKWSIKQVVGHVTDIERLFGYRALAFARLDPSPLPSIEQDDYVKHANFDERPLADILAEFEYVRLSFLALFRGFNDEMLLRRGTASGLEFTVRSIPFIMAGHEIHHVKVLRERYL